jgi:hypothetical protein
MRDTTYDNVDTTTPTPYPTETGDYNVDRNRLLDAYTNCLLRHEREYAYAVARGVENDPKTKRTLTGLEALLNDYRNKLVNY